MVQTAWWTDFLINVGSFPEITERLQFISVSPSCQRTFGKLATRQADSDLVRPNHHHRRGASVL